MGKQGANPERRDPPAVSTPYPDTLVWGACGFMGRHLVARLLELGGRVSVLTRPRELYRAPPWSSRVEWIELAPGANPAERFQQAVGSASVVFDFAGSTGAARSNRQPIESLDENNRLQLEFLEACGRSPNPLHVVFTSSRLVYGRPKSTPVDETHPTKPLSMYAAHKRCCEHYFQIFATSGAISYTICRISNAFGFDPDYRKKDHGVINSFIQQGLAGEPLTLFGDGSQLRDYIYIEDLIDALLLCGLRAESRNQTFNVGTGTGITMRHAAQEIQRATGAPELRFVPWPPEHKRVESGDYVADITKIRSLLQFCPRYSFRAGLAEMIRVSPNSPPAAKCE